MWVLNLLSLGAKRMIMFPQVNRQYLCLPNLNTLNVLLGTLNQVWLRITMSSLLHKPSFVFSIQRVDCESFFLSARLNFPATSMIHRRRVPVKRGENRIGS